MNEPSYRIRNYQKKDQERVSRFKAELETLLSPRGPLGSPDLDEGFLLSKCLPEADVFVVEKGDTIIGFAKVRPEVDIDRTVLTLILHPNHWRGDLPRALIECSVKRTRQLHIKKIHIHISDDSPVLKELLLGMGFRPVRRYLELRLDLSMARLSNPLPEGFELRRFQRGDEHTLTQIQNRAFAGTWGYSANTPEDVRERTVLPNFSPEDIILCFDGMKPIGYCWTRITRQPVGGLLGQGRIFMLGVHPDYRRKGISRHLLFAGLSYLKAKQVREVELTVDEANKAARALYLAAGFKPRMCSVWFERSLA